MTMVDQALQIEPPHNEEAYAQLARSLLRQNRVDEALQAALAAYQRQSTDPEIQLVLATVLAARGQDDQVLLLIEAALGHRADYAEALALRAMVRLRHQDITAALADMERCLTIKPHLSQVWRLMALLGHQFGLLSEAIAALQRALRHDPGHVDSMIDLGDYHRQNGDVFVALTWLQKAVAMAPSNARGWDSLGTALQQCQRVSEARAAYVKALELMPQADREAYGRDRQLVDPAEEWQLRATITILTRIDADPSEVPAPYWFEPEPIVRQPFPQQEPLDVLVVGCKTGQSAVAVARQFPGARIKAVDLSLANLAYAQRKTQQLGLDTIEYVQADLLQLGLLNRTFDLIKMADVLEQLADPATGWRVLLSLLRPGGVMHLQSPRSSIEAFLRATPQLTLLASDGDGVWLQRDSNPASLKLNI
ncbi:MAG: methyltransferase domain-containing protein [Magnetococcales bacterium]|nr:methyltransferase domain-containing protein [Magnetococcales bacterium]